MREGEIDKDRKMAEGSGDYIPEGNPDHIPDFIPLKNPLPVPPRRSHIRMDFDLADPGEDDFDLEISPDDDFDI